MRLAIVHYHLQSGGVTRIIQHILTALKGSDISVVVLTGKEPGNADWYGEYRVVPGLLYESERPSISPDALASEMLASAVEALGGPPDVWHVHNHSLGKSLVLPGALNKLAADGHHLLFHIHDFAEDGRPANYRSMLSRLASGVREELSRLLYPFGDHLHYGVLNSRDYCYLLDAGVADSQLHLLPNPVALTASCDHYDPPDESDEKFWLYPTRAIRRKNLGEFLFWAAIAPEGHRFATTLGPENPAEWPRYKRWKQVCSELELPVTFELARKSGLGFIEMLHQATALITTSVAEGFGLAFLEPWLVNRPVCGRDLAEITNEFRLQGIELPWLYDRLNVPVEWLGVERMSVAARAGLQRSMAAYGRSPSEEELQRLDAAWIQGGMVDFGRLDESMQEKVLHLVTKFPETVQSIHPNSLPDLSTSEDIIAGNCHSLAARYSLEGYGRALEACYQQVTRSHTSSLEALNGEVLLDHFLAPERLSLLRVD